MNVKATVFLATEQASILQAQIPASQARQLNRMLPIALEEQVAIDLDGCQFKALEKVNKGKVWTCVYQNQNLENIRQSLADISVEVDFVTLEAWCLPQNNPNAILLC